MINTSEILKALRDRSFVDGLTQQEISSKSGVSRSYICDLLNGKRDIGGITLRTLIALFPDATLYLRDAPLVNAPSNSGNVVGVNHGTANMGCRSDVIREILNSDELTSDEKVKVMKVLQK